MLHRILLASLVITGLAFAVGSASAQTLAQEQALVRSSTPGLPTVSGSASVAINPEPEKYRMWVELRAFGTSAEAALKNLKLRREAAKAQLKKLNADEDAIGFAAPHVNPVSPPPEATPAIPSYSAPVPVGPADSSGNWRSPPPASTYTVSSSPLADPAIVPPPTTTPPNPARLAVPGNKPRPPRPPMFIASTTMVVDWPLKGKDIDKIVANAEAIRAKVLAGDVTGEKAALERLSPEDRELAEEAELRRSNPIMPPIDPVGPATMAPAAPAVSYTIAYGVTSRPITFNYVAFLSKKQRKPAFADAYAQANQRAAEMAEIAGMSIGDIASLNGNMSNWPHPNAYMADGGASLTQGEDEAVATTPDGLRFIFYVQATYRLLPAKPKK